MKSCVLSSLSFTIVLCAIFRSFSQNCESRSSKRSLSISILSTWYSILEPWFSIVSSIDDQVSIKSFKLFLNGTVGDSCRCGSPTLCFYNQVSVCWSHGLQVPQVAGEDYLYIYIIYAVSVEWIMLTFYSYEVTQFWVPTYEQTI